MLEPLEESKVVELSIRKRSCWISWSVRMACSKYTFKAKLIESRRTWRNSKLDFKDYAELLAFSITKIINASFKEQRLPFIWKVSNVSPLPKIKPVTELGRDLRPISLTACLSKIAEEFIVCDYVRPAVLTILDPCQYGAIRKSSTTYALIHMVHNWVTGTDGNGATVRTILLEPWLYRKTFDIIHHSILCDKLYKFDLPKTVINWIIDFQSDRLQRIKLDDGCFSEWGSVPSGVPQGTKLDHGYTLC